MAAIHDRKRPTLQVNFLAPELAFDVFIAAAVDVAAGVTDWMVIDPGVLPI